MYVVRSLVRTSAMANCINQTGAGNIFVSSLHMVYITDTLDLICDQHLTRTTSRARMVIKALSIPEIQASDYMWWLIFDC